MTIGQDIGEIGGRRVGKLRIRRRRKVFFSSFQKVCGQFGIFLFSALFTILSAGGKKFAI